MSEIRAGRPVKTFRVWQWLSRFFTRLRHDPERERRAVALFVGVIGVGALVLGFLGIRQQLNEPYAFLLQNLSDEELAKLQTDLKKVLEGEQTTNLQALKGKDTDADGLNDYDELYTYSTSPYLQDTDSDTFSDAKEIETQNDPNCPSGKICAEGGIQTGAASTDASVEDIRKTLIDAGISESFLSLMSDEDLVKFYNETVKETGIDISKFDTSSIANINASAEGGMSAEDIRAFLRSTGQITEEQLQSIDDATLVKVYGEALQETFNNENTAQ